MKSADFNSSIKDVVEPHKPFRQKLTEFLADSHKILKVSGRLTKYVVKITPLFMGIFVMTLTLLAIEPLLVFWTNSKIIDLLINMVTTKTGTIQDIINYVGLAIAVRIIATVMDRLGAYANQNIWFKVGRAIEMDLTKKYAYLDTQDYENPELRDTLAKVGSSAGKLQTMLTSMFGVFDATVEIISATLILTAFYPLLILILLITGVPVLFVDLLFGKKAWGIWALKGNRRRDYGSTKFNLTDENKLMEVRIFGLRSILLDRILQLYNEFELERLKIENKRAYITTGVTIFGIIGGSAAYILIILKVLAFEITIGQFNFFVSTTGRFDSGFRKLLNRLSAIYEDGLYVVDIFTVLDIQPKVIPGTIKLGDSDTPPVIEFRNVSFRYPNTEPMIIENFNLRIGAGEKVAFVGENGAGKTTLIKLLMRFYDVTEGQILIDGIDIKELDLETWYTKVGVLFQQFNRYHFAAKNNIAIGNVHKEFDMEKVIDSAKRSGADKFIQKYSKGYDQILNRSFTNGIDPSTGQWQKIAMARAFYKDAQVLVLDEPTSAIDPKAEFEIFENLFETAQDKSIIIISHRFSTVRNASRILVLEDGKIIEDGTHEMLMEIDGGVYKKAFEIQRKGYE